ncbi:hypothetical protein HDU78_005884 [Chytriomyces hyalinus]|nr:hypothetical protein HDU78_005884 [Chytriomyces hyalinus]
MGARDRTGNGGPVKQESTKPNTQSHYKQVHSHNLAHRLAHAAPLLANRTANHHHHQQRVTPRNVHIRPSLCGSFTVVAEEYAVALSDATGYIPMDRRCLVRVYERLQVAKGAVLLVHGFASNRTIFSIGGGNGKSGPSFFEYLASRGFDTYAIDMRGTRESMSMGSMAPAYIKEHIEVDVPSAIACIKRLGHEKVYLIGHSMGGAISCAVAGQIPHDVAGVVHLAGLYHLTIPILGDVVDMYRASCPQPVQDLIHAGAGLAFRSLLHIFSPALQSLTGALSVEKEVAKTASISATQIAHRPKGKHLSSVANPPKRASLSNSAKYAATYIRRQRLPIRPVVEALLYVRRFLPPAVSQAVMNMLYPSPWLPYSVEDPGSMIDLSLESPTVGILVSVGKLALNSDLNQWLESSSAHRAEIPQTPKSGKKSPDDSHGDLKTLRNSSASPKNQVNGIQAVPLKISDIESVVIQKNGSSEWGTGASDGDDEDSLPEDSTHSLLKGNSSRIRTPSTVTASPPNDLVDTEGTASEPPEPKVVKNIKQEVEAAAKQMAKNGDGHFMQGWDELGPYLEQFERLEHLPLFFCPANADQILRTEDCMAGYRRSGSRWKESIVYRDTKSPGKPVNGASKSNGSQTDMDLNKLINSKSVKQVPHITTTPATMSVRDIEASVLGSYSPTSISSSSSNGPGISSMRTSSTGPLSPTSPERLKRVSSGSSFVKSTLFNPAYSTGASVFGGSGGVPAAPGPSASLLRPPPSVTISGGSNILPRDTFEIEEDINIKQTRDAAKSRLLGPEYSVPSSYKYGHCDILGGQHAEEVWHRIADWLDVTSAREKEWRFRRRYSAK